MSYHADELDLGSILDASPNLHDVYDLTMCQSTKWDKLGRKLNVPLEFRKRLRTSDSSVEEKLEEVLNEWIESKRIPVTWSEFIEALEEIEMNDVAANINVFLKTPNAIKTSGKF